MSSRSRLGCPGFTTVKPRVNPVIYGAFLVTACRATVMSWCFPVLKTIATGENRGDTWVNQDAIGVNLGSLWLNSSQWSPCEYLVCALIARCLPGHPLFTFQFIMAEPRWCHSLSQFSTSLPVHHWLYLTVW